MRHHIFRSIFGGQAHDIYIVVYVVIDEQWKSTAAPMPIPERLDLDALMYRLLIFQCPKVRI
jgi:hypothetical protein